MTMYTYDIEVLGITYKFEHDKPDWTMITPQGFITKNSAPWVLRKWGKVANSMHFSPDTWQTLAAKLKMRAEATEPKEEFESEVKKEDSHGKLFSFELVEDSGKWEYFIAGLEHYFRTSGEIHLIGSSFINIIEDIRRPNDFISVDISAADGYLKLATNGLLKLYDKTLPRNMPGLSVAREHKDLAVRVINNYTTGSNVDLHLVRSGIMGDAFLFDTGSEVYQVTQDGIGQIHDAHKIMLRVKNFKKTVKPAKASASDVLRLKEIIPWGPWQMWQVLTWSMGAMWGIKDNPGLFLSGEAGTGKTNGIGALANILDPREGGNVLDVSTQTEDTLTLILSQYRLVVLDNMNTKIPAKISNMFCTAITGGTTARRELYTTGDLVSFPYTAKIALTAIGIYGMQADLQDRLMQIQTLPLKQRVSRTEYQTRVNELAPTILGSYLEMTRKVLGIWQETLADVKKYGNDIRLQDTVAIGEAMARILGAPKNLYAEAMAETQRMAWCDKMDDSPLVMKLKQHFDDAGVMGYDEITKTNSEWVDILNITDGNGKIVNKMRFRKYMDGQAALLRRAGFTFKHDRNVKKTSGMSIKYDHTLDTLQEDKQSDFCKWLISVW